VKLISKILVVVLALAVVHGAAQAGPEVQKTGKQVFPGKLVLGLHPLGFQVGFVNNAGGTAYKLSADIAGLLKDWQGPGVQLYLGGGFNYATSIVGCVGCAHLIEIWAFVRLHINKLNIPLVPFVQAGIAGLVGIYGGAFTGGFIGTGGGAGFRFGGGLHYWIIKNLGLGVETNFNFGGVSAGNAGGFFGYWDFLVGAQAAF